MTGFQRIAVIDIGKTNAKVVVLDGASGAEIVAKRIPNRVLNEAPYPHYDTDGLWSFMVEALRELAAQPGFDAISITTHGACAALLDAHGDLAMPVLDYEHDYPVAIRDAYASLRPPFAETFSPPLSMGLNLGAQLHYQKAVFPDVFAQVATILTYPQYWAFRLTGIAANEATSLGCHTDLWSPQSGTYSALVEALGITHRMAPLRSAFDVLGPVLPGIAKDIGLERPVPVFCGIHDSNASLLAHLVARERPFSVVSTGTWVISFAVGGDLGHLDPARDTLANVDAYGHAVPSSRFMGGREFEMLAAELGLFNAEEAMAVLQGVIDRRLMLLPSLASGSGPFPERRSAWVNDRGASFAERWAAGCLYLGLMTDTCLSLIGAKGTTIVEGPFAANPVYLGLLVAIRRGDIIASPGSTGTSQGAALLAGIHPPGARGTVTSPILAEGLDTYCAEWRAMTSSRPDAVSP